MTKKPRTCWKGNKKRYHDEAEAKRAISNVRAHGIGRLTDTGKVPQRAYRCSECGGWHLTSEEQRS